MIRIGRIRRDLVGYRTALWLAVLPAMRWYWYTVRPDSIPRKMGQSFDNQRAVDLPAADPQALFTLTLYESIGD